MTAYITDNYKPEPNNEIERYLHFVKKLLWAKRGHVELTCLHDLLNAEVEILSTQCFDLLEKFTGALRDVSENTRILVSEIVGVLWATGGTISEFNHYVNIFIFRIDSNLSTICIQIKLKPKNVIKISDK